MTDQSSPVHVRVAADLAQLPVLRAIAETIALLADFTLDEVADIRLAVDEVASVLILGSPGHGDLCCDFTVDPTGMAVRVWTTWAAAGLPDEHSFGWHVLRTLTDSITATQHPYDATAAGYPTTVEFSRTRGSLDGE